MDQAVGRSASPAHDKLIEATIRSIHDHGLASTTVDSICDASGLSRGMIRHCFESKDMLMVASYKGLCDEWAKERLRRRDLYEASDPAILYAAADDIFGPRAMDPAKVSAWLSFSVASLSEPRLREVNRQAYAAMRDEFETDFATVAAKSKLSLDPWQAACGLLALTDGLWLQHLLEPDLMTRDLATATCRTFIDNALSAGKTTT